MNDTEWFDVFDVRSILCMQEKIAMHMASMAIKDWGIGWNSTVVKNPDIDDISRYSRLEFQSTIQISIFIYLHRFP